MPEMLCPTCLTAFKDEGQAACPRCGTPIDRPEPEPIPEPEPVLEPVPEPEPVAEPVAERDVLPPPSAEKSAPLIKPPDDPRLSREVPPRPAGPAVGDPVGAIVGRLVCVFAAVGFGLGIGVLLFLWATGFFDPVEGLDDFGRVFVGGLAVGAVFVFALLIGVVVAVIAGVHAATTAGSRSSATTAGLVAGAIGHIALVVVLGAILLVGFEVLAPDTTTPPAQAAATPTAAPVPCEEIFGIDSAVCEEAEDVSESSSVGDSTDDVTLTNLSKLGLGVIPAALVGAVTGAFLFQRRTDRS